MTEMTQDEKRKVVKTVAEAVYREVPEEIPFIVQTLLSPQAGASELLALSPWLKKRGWRWEKQGHWWALSKAGHKGIRTADDDSLGEYWARLACLALVAEDGGFND